ncbi:MAG: PH domain-containing protein [Muribaculaceae bacterium]|nr:PH domain-containing protein [Muribaculaceae bacterium]
MEKFGGRKFSSRWDGSTWFILGLVAACCVVPCFLDDGIWPTIVCLVMLAFVLLTFMGIYYRIDGDKLMVYTFFRPTAYPIDKIKEIKPTNSVLSSPAVSLSHRLAITFTDRKILKSSIPLIISPVRQDEFIELLLAVNPDIKTY